MIQKLFNLKLETDIDLKPWKAYWTRGQKSRLLCTAMYEKKSYTWMKHRQRSTIEDTVESNRKLSFEYEYVEKHFN